MLYQRLTVLLSMLTLRLSNTDANIVLLANPSSIQPGITSSLEINCSFILGSEANISTVFSIILSKAQKANDTNFLELASINAFGTGQVSQLVNSSATAHGQIGLYHDPYLSLKWNFPSVNEAGFYHCSANGMDQVGHPAAFEKTIEVASHRNGTVSSCCDDCILALQAQIDSLAKKLPGNDLYMSKLYEISNIFNGKRYYLSKQYWRNADVAEANCEIIGGYLAEIDDVVESQFLKDFLQPFVNVDIVLVGATDEYIEGQWIFRYSKQPLVFEEWEQGEPGNSTHDCTVLYGFKNWRMHDFPCYDYELEVRRYYLCEVPI